MSNLPGIFFSIAIGFPLIVGGLYLYEEYKGTKSYNQKVWFDQRYIETKKHKFKKNLVIYIIQILLACVVIALLFNIK